MQPRMTLSIRPLILKVGGDSSQLWWGDARYIPERSGSPLQAERPINPTSLFWCVEVRTFLLWGCRANHWTAVTPHDAVFAVVQKSMQSWCRMRDIFFFLEPHIFLPWIWRIWHPQSNSNADSLYRNISVWKHLCLSRTFGTLLFLHGKSLLVHKKLCSWHFQTRQQRESNSVVVLSEGGNKRNWFFST